MRKSVVLPEPLGPTRPTFSPGLSWKDASTNRICLPYCLEILENEIIQLSVISCRVSEEQLPLADKHRLAPYLYFHYLTISLGDGDVDTARASHLDALA